MRYSWRMGFLCAHRSWAGVLCALLLSLPALSVARKSTSPPDSTLLPASFRETIERGVANGAYQSVAVGLIDGKQRGTFYFGHRDGADSKPADDKSLFEIGAVGEVFTGLLLAQAALEGKLRLSDPIEKFLPAPFPFTDARLGKITLLQLATQHSALPARPANLFPADLDDPYAGYAAEDLLALLAFHRSSAKADDAAYGYSILNAGLLGHLLGRIYQMPLGEALAAKIFSPLGLKRLTFADDTDLLPGHARGASAPHRHYGALIGAAGLRAGLPDLLGFLQLNLTPNDSPLRAALLLARRPDASGPADQLGFGWNVREKIDGTATWPLVWRASQTAGFASFIGFRTDKQKAIVVLGNATEDVAALGIAWLGDTSPPETAHGFADAGSNRLEEYPGLYRVASGVDAIVRADEQALSLQMPGALPARLQAADKDVFVADDAGFGVTFIRDIDEIVGLVLHGGGQNVSAKRLSARAPRLARVPIGIDAAARSAMLGDYRLDDATWLRIAESAQGLNLQWTMAERRRIFPYAPSRFTDADGAVELQIKRTADGRVAGIDLDLAGTRREAVPLRKYVH
ncbi:MAG: beta-lactamase family protein [Rudaea sp.]|uniref:serine hydrolase domain-containing protein n=1 Tax=unclassified Rudaea TaxID=2627037 RepID=UPI0010FA3249|nr:MULTISPECIES: serine hydrolase domain-containing protein [unclassified Rudaea]MBN8885326.1 beta-lactamase family protein [Rudaea sp.]MBR0347306.1 beta-lactamase family protein [Rudaea sp.]